MAYEWQSIEEAASTLGISSRTLHRRISRNDVETRLEAGRREVLVCLPDEPEPAAMPQPAEITGEPTYSTAPTDPDRQRQTSDTFASASPIGQGADGFSKDTAPAGTTAAVSATASPAQHKPEVDRSHALALSEDRLRRADLAMSAFQRQINSAEQDLRRARNHSAVAWSCVGILIITAFIGITSVTHKIARAQADSDFLVRQMHDMNDRQMSDAERAQAELDRASAEIDRQRQTAESAKIRAASAEGELKATQTFAGRFEALAATPAKAATRPATQPAASAMPSRAGLADTKHP